MQVFFVFRKKQSQVSFLHIYHHLLVIQGAWLSAKYFPGITSLVFSILLTRELTLYNNNYKSNF